MTGGLGGQALSPQFFLRFNQIWTGPWRLAQRRRWPEPAAPGGKALAFVF